MSFACPTTNRRKPAEVPPHVLDFVADVVDVVMRPVAENEPSLLSKLFADPGIALDVSPDFRLPPSSIALRPSPMEWAPMPETAVEEHRDLGPREGNVRTSGCWAIVDAKAQSSSMQLSSQFNLRLGIAPLDSA